MRKLPLFLVLVALLAGCELGPQGPVLVSPGPVAAGRLAVQTDVAWTQMPSKPPRRLWTVYGPLLDLVVLVDGLEEGQQLFSSEASAGTPVAFRAAATGAGLGEFVLDSLRREGAAALSLDSLRPVAFAGGEGVRAEFRLRDDRGVAKRGFAVARVIDGRLYMILFVAAEDHYFPSLAPAVERIVESARIV